VIVDHEKVKIDENIPIIMWGHDGDSRQVVTMEVWGEGHFMRVVGSFPVFSSRFEVNWNEGGRTLEIIRKGCKLSLV